jgi:RND family efflux transporter MFP subunit
MNKINLYIIAILFIGLLSACGSDHSSTTKQQSALSVKVATAAMNPQAQQLTYSGKVESAANAVISTRMSGVIEQIKVKPGSFVQKGQLLVQISDNDLKAKLSQIIAAQNAAKTAFEIAEKDLERYTKLYEQKSASKKELEQIQLHYKYQQSQYEMTLEQEKELNEALTYTSIRAPFKGVITSKFVNAGELANPGMPLLGLESDKAFNVKALIPESEINQVSIGDKIAVDIKSAKLKGLHARVIELNPSALHSMSQFELKLSLDLSDEVIKQVKSGMFANVVITRNPVACITVPKSSLIQKGQLTGIYTVSTQNKALLRWVRTGKTNGESIEILSGLVEGEKYITSYQGKIWDGASIKISK